MTTTTKAAEKMKLPPQPPCLCLACKRPECHGIGKPLSRLAAIKASAAKHCTCPGGKRCSP